MTNAVDEVLPREAGRCIATLIRVLGDIDLAEDAVAEAFAIAAESRPRTGIPPQPGRLDHHSLPATAPFTASDANPPAASGNAVIPSAPHRQHGPSPTIPNSTTSMTSSMSWLTISSWSLMFLCVHPALGADAQVALILRLRGRPGDR